jgi:DNA-directed RNA polymerase subunit RPC12/RpoP
MIVVNKPFTEIVFFRDNLKESQRMQPYLISDGQLDYYCGGCKQSLLHNIHPGQITKAVYKCPKCGNYNQIDQKH